LLLSFSLRRYRSTEMPCSWRTTRRRRGTVCRVRRRLLLCEVPSLRSTSRDVSKRRELAALQRLRTVSRRQRRGWTCRQL
jgi:hypothetical protein